MSVVPTHDGRNSQDGDTHQPHYYHSLSSQTKLYPSDPNPKTDVTPATKLHDFDARQGVASVTGRVARSVMARRTVARLVFGIERCSIVLLLHTEERGLSVGLSVCHAIVSPAKMPEAIEMPFGLWGRMGPPRNRIHRNHRSHQCDTLMA